MSDYSFEISFLTGYTWQRAAKMKCIQSSIRTTYMILDACHVAGYSTERNA